MPSLGSRSKSQTTSGGRRSGDDSFGTCTTTVLICFQRFVHISATHADFVWTVGGLCKHLLYLAHERFSVTVDKDSLEQACL